MGPIRYTSGVGLPVEPADRAAAGDLAMQGDKDRRQRQASRRRHHHEEESPDADQFTHKEEQPEPEA